MRAKGKGGPDQALDSARRLNGCEPLFRFARAVLGPECQGLVHVTHRLNGRANPSVIDSSVLKGVP